MLVRFSIMTLLIGASIPVIVLAVSVLSHLAGLPCVDSNTGAPC